MKLRLARLEKQVGRIVDAPCTLCCGHPFAVIVEAWREDPRASHPLGVCERRPGEGQAERLTPDLRCRRCGRAAQVVVITTPLTPRARATERPRVPEAPGPAVPVEG